MERGHAFMIRLCSDRASYEALPRRRLKIDLAKLRRDFQLAGKYEVTLWTRQLMVIKRNDAIEITIVDDGRMIIRNVLDEETARGIAETLLPELTAGEH